MKLLYFAWVRQKVGHVEEDVAPPADVGTVADLIGWLKQQGPGYQAAFEDEHLVRVAVDQEHADVTTSINGAQEVAFFPPVTGG